VGFQHTDYVVAIFLFTDKQAALYVLGFAARLNDVAVRVFLDVLDGVIEVIEFLIRNDVDAGFFQFLLAEGAVVFQLICVGGATYDFLSFGAQGLRFFTLSQSVIKDDDVRPFGVFLRVFGFGYKAIGNIGFFFLVDVVADFVSFFGNLPGNVAD